MKVFQDCSPSVANISTSTTATIGMSMNPIEIPRGTGSAFVWDTDGHIVTNYHVVMNGNKAKITLADASTWEGTVIGGAKNKDLAVLKISAPASKLKPIVVGSSQVDLFSISLALIPEASWNRSFFLRSKSLSMVNTEVYFLDYRRCKSGNMC